MHFQHIGYVVSKRPYARELRVRLADTVSGSIKGRIRRLLRGKFRRYSVENRRKYDLMAGTYYSPIATSGKRLAVFRGCLTMTSDDEIRADNFARVFERIRKIGAKRVLEVGCGDGNNLAMLKRQMPELELTGIDISPRRIDFARKHHEDLGLSITWGVASATSLPFADASFDLVFSNHCLEHMPREFREAIDEMTRVARKLVIMIEPIHEVYGPLQTFYAYAIDYVSGIPAYLESRGVRVECISPLGSGTNPFNLPAFICFSPPGA